MRSAEAGRGPAGDVRASDVGLAGGDGGDVGRGAGKPAPCKCSPLSQPEGACAEASAYHQHCC